MVKTVRKNYYDGYYSVTYLDGKQIRKSKWHSTKLGGSWNKASERKALLRLKLKTEPRKKYYIPIDVRIANEGYRYNFEYICSFAVEKRDNEEEEEVTFTVGSDVLLTRQEIIDIIYKMIQDDYEYKRITSEIDIERLWMKV